MHAALAHPKAEPAAGTAAHVSFAFRDSRAGLAGERAARGAAAAGAGGVSSSAAAGRVRLQYHDDLLDHVFQGDQSDNPVLLVAHERHGAVRVAKEP